MGNDKPEKRKKVDFIEEVFEKFLWNARLIILFGVIGLLISSAWYSS